MMGDISPFLFPGNGLPMREASSGGVAIEGDTDISNGGYSETFSPNDCLDVIFDIICLAGSATGNVDVEKGIDAAFSAVTTVASLNINSVRTGSFTVSRSSSAVGDSSLGRYYRLKNSTGRVINVWMQKRIR